MASGVRSTSQRFCPTPHAPDRILAIASGQRRRREMNGGIGAGIARFAWRHAKISTEQGAEMAGRGKAEIQSNVENTAMLMLGGADGLEASHQPATPDMLLHAAMRREQPVESRA